MFGQQPACGLADRSIYLRELAAGFHVVAYLLIKYGIFTTRVVAALQMAALPAKPAGLGRTFHFLAF